ncbi:histone-lysine N-methyltransferase trr-like [Teleopsis dalmanni]|uniref:histone-lysine N-methyltransferase trr-like n=1 Tax=Teleopsis dalmanni TaxID=139649 RepID=UPI0018CE1926|nr:histone-lysine N-methyltransferase trr-like [Teleopsis dalmanni]
MDKNCIKRSIDTNDDDNNKKIKIDISGSKLIWNYTDNPNIIQAKTIDESLQDEANKQKSETSTSTEFSVYSDEKLQVDKDIKNLNNSVKADRSNECVVFAPNIMEFTESKDKDNKNITSSATTSTTSLTDFSHISLTNTPQKITRNDITSSTISTSDTINISSFPGSSSDEIELVLIPSSQELSIANFQKKTDNNGKKNLPANINIIRQSAPSYSRITTLNSNTGVQSTPGLWNRVTLHSTLRNQPIMVASKKLPPEVTQTTAKVSIGNTTISVPLLKPLNSTSLITPNITSDNQKNTQPPNIAQQQQQQNTINVNNFVNVKRGPKITHPTIVSLSQLQIKPVSTAKIVQAKVLSKKVPIIIPQTSLTMQNSVQATPGVITITATKPKQNIGDDSTQNTITPITISRDNAACIMVEKKDLSTETSIAEIIKKNEFGATLESNRKTLPFKTVVKEKSVMEETNFSNRTEVSLSEDIKRKIVNGNEGLLTFCSEIKPANPKEILVQQQSKTLKYTTYTNMRAPAQQYTNKIGTNSTVIPSSTIESHTNTTLTSDNIAAKLHTTPLISIPKNISLVIAKSNITQQQKSNISNTVTCTDAFKKKLNVTKPVTLTALTTTQLKTTSQSVEIAQNTTSVSLALQSNNVKTVDSGLERKKLNLDTANINQNQKQYKSTLKTFEEKKFDTDKAIETKNISIESTELSNIIANSNVTNTTELDNNQIIDNTYETKSYQHMQEGEPNTVQISVPKLEDSQNVLLKQLLQNSNAIQKTDITSNSNAASVSKGSTLLLCNNIPSARKVGNVRAPCLGLVSSLEAQLARPVIPPVPATAASPVNYPQQVVTKTENNTATNQNQDISTEESDIIQNKVKLKTSNIISKETSFVSNPNISHELPENLFSVQMTVPEYESELSSNHSVPIQRSLSNNEISQKELPPNVSLAVSENNQSLSSMNKEVKCKNTSSVNISSIKSTDTKNFGKDQILNITSTEHNIPIKTTIVSDQRTYNIQQITNTSAQNSTVNVNKLDSAPKDVSNNITVSKTIEPPKTINTTQLVSSVATNNLLIQKQNTRPSPVECSNIIKPESGFIDLELRKKRKRDYQKQRRQLTNNANKILAQTAAEPATTVPNALAGKKRQRKISKMEEDHDSYVDNLMGHIRQMQPLQVLEPLLNRTYGACSLYGAYSNSTRGTRNIKEYKEQAMDCSDEYGKALRTHVTSLYDAKRFSGSESNEDKHLPTIQNDFYDQEFSPLIYKNDYENFIRFVTSINERNIEPIDITNGENNITRLRYCSEDKCTGRCNLLYSSHPGICTVSEKFNHCLDRMSPIIPLVQPTLFKKKSVNMILKQTLKKIDKSQEKKCENDTFMRKQEKEVKTGKKNVILSISMANANHILRILKDLANILNITPPTSYKIIDKPPDVNNQETISTNGKSKSKSISMQKILNGSVKICRFCGDNIKRFGVQNQQNKFNSKKSINSSKQSSKLIFCNKICYVNFLASEKNQSTENPQKFKPFKLPKALKFDNEPGPGAVETSCNLNPLLSESSINTNVPNQIKFKYYSKNCFQNDVQNNSSRVEKGEEQFETTSLAKSNLSALLNKNIKSTAPDTRQCVLCSQRGDGWPNGPSRLLNFDVDKWVHLNCALWSNGVYETLSGGLMNFPSALHISFNQYCTSCQKIGATIKCFKTRCNAVYHLACAIKEQCAFYKNKTIICQTHTLRTEKENEISSLIVHRRVFIDRDEVRQMSNVMYHHDSSNLLRIGSLTLLNMGQLLPHQLHSFHTADCIYPIGYKSIRIYWSMKHVNQRSRYVCSIAEVAGRPEFRIQIDDPSEKDVEFRAETPKAAWRPILESIVRMRNENKLLQLFPQFIAGEDLFGLTEPSIVRILESLPGVETLTEYRFKYGRNHLLELPLAINPSGAARTEQKQRQLLCLRKPHTQRTSTAFRITNNTPVVVAGEVACPYSKQFVHSKSSQYKKMKQEWRYNVYLARSKIQGLGLYAARDIERHTMIIEYIGEVIRTEVSEIREKQYEAKNRGIYMFRLDENRVVDATLSGGLARYINHSCNPNCVTEIVEVDREVRIIIFAKRRISRGEELSYDYKFDIEDDANKIQCMCGASNCQKWMN